MKNSDLCVPLKALGLPGEGGGDVTPAQGDDVDFSGTGTVSRIEGDKAYITPKTINGENVESAAAPMAKSLDDEETEMRDDAAKADRLY